MDQEYFLQIVESIEDEVWPSLPNSTLKITFIIKSPNQRKKWDKAEVKDLTDYHTVKESTIQNYINIWLWF